MHSSSFVSVSHNKEITHPHVTSPPTSIKLRSNQPAIGNGERKNEQKQQQKKTTHTHAHTQPKDDSFIRESGWRASITLREAKQREIECWAMGMHDPVTAPRMTLEHLFAQLVAAAFYVA